RPLLPVHPVNELLDPAQLRPKLAHGLTGQMRFVRPELSDQRSSWRGGAIAYISLVRSTCVSRFSSSQRSASMAARQPSPAAVTAWRYTWSRTSPAANTPGMLVIVDAGSGILT